MQCPNHTYKFDSRAQNAKIFTLHPLQSIGSSIFYFPAKKINMHILDIGRASTKQLPHMEMACK